MKFTKLQNGVLRSADELGINYIENGDAELASPAPSLYADSGSSPTDGSGGSVNTSTELNFSRSTSSPLRGSASWVFDKKSGNQQGKGGSFPFTIDVADKGKQVQITFDYSVLSGTYATGDVAVYVVHAPSGTPKVIQPSAFNIENVGVESLARLTFQTEYSSILDYNLCFHVASTSASAYSLKFDNITLGPQVVPLGAPVTGWVSFTPLWQSNGTAPAIGNGSIAGRWRQVGGAADIEIRLSLGSTSTTGTGTSFITWPSFMDLQPLNGSFSEGTCFMYTNNTATSRSGTPQFYNTERRFGVYLSEVGQWGGGATDWGGAGDTMTITVRGVPVVGWSSSTVVSSSADTRVVVTKLIRSTSATGINPNASYVKVPLNTVNIDTVGAADVANNQVVIKVPGKYNVSWSLGIGSTNVLASQYLSAVYKNGGAEAYGNTCTPSATTSFISSGSTDMELAVGDVLDLRLFGAGNNSVNTLSSFTGTGVSLSVSLIQGPSQIAASEVIAVSCVSPSGSVGLENTVVFTTKVFDTHNAYNTSTGVFTAPAPGIYEFKCYGLTNSMTQGTSGALQLYTRINGGGNTACAWALGNGANINQSVFGTALISLQAGQTVEFRQTSTTSGTWNSGRYSVIRLGGVM